MVQVHLCPKTHLHVIYFVYRLDGKRVSNPSPKTVKESGQMNGGVAYYEGEVYKFYGEAAQSTGSVIDS